MSQLIWSNWFNRVLGAKKFWGFNSSSKFIKKLINVKFDCKILLLRMCLYYLLMERERGVQGHQAFAFCEVNVNDEPCKTKVQKKA